MRSTDNGLTHPIKTGLNFCLCCLEESSGESLRILCVILLLTAYLQGDTGLVTGTKEYKYYSPQNWTGAGGLNETYQPRMGGGIPLKLVLDLPLIKHPFSSCSLARAPRSRNS